MGHSCPPTRSLPSPEGPPGGHAITSEALDALAEAVVVLAPDGQVLAANRSAEEVLGAGGDRTLSGSTWGRLREHLVSDTGAELNDANDEVQAVLRTGVPLDGFLVGSRARDDTIGWHSLSARTTPTGGNLVVSMAQMDRRRGASRHARFYAVRSAISRAIVKAADRRDLIQRVCRAALVGGQLKMAWLGFVGPDGSISPEAWAGDERGYLDGIVLSAVAGDPHAGGPSGMAVQRNQPVATRDIASDPTVGPWRARALSHGYRSSAALPVTRGGRPCGVFTVYSGEVGTFDDDELGLLAGIAEDISFGLEALEAGKAAADSEARYRTIVETAQEGIWTVDTEGRITFANASMAAMLGVPRETLPGRSVFEFVEEQRREAARAGLLRRQKGIADPQEAALLRPDGRIILTRMAGVPLRGDDGEWQGALAMVSDITEQARAERELRDSEERWRAMVQHSSDIIAVVNLDGTIRYVSPAVEAILGYGPAEVVGRSALELVKAEDRAVVAAVIADSMAWADSLRGPDIPPGPFELRVIQKSGSERWLAVQATNLTGTKAVSGFVLNARDVTDRKNFEARLEHQALHDPLTGLPNRALLLDRLEQALARADRTGASVGVLFLDIDQFKLVNDSRGHATGDEALTAIATILSRTVRPSDTVARFGGDEFVILAEDITSEQEMMGTAERVRKAVQGQLRLSEETLHVTVSIGAALSDHRSSSELLSAADAAMYRAKETGRNRSAVYEAEMREQAADRLSLETDLRQAIATSSLVVHYQPIVDIAQMSVAGFEALVRWEHPGRGTVMPDQFIPLAEQTGLIVELGELVLRRAVRQLAAWSRPHPTARLHMAVNVSTRQLLDPALVAKVSDTIDRFQLAPGALVLEITETALMDNIDEAVEVLGRLKQAGVRLAIDDFGTGYSSLGYLKRLPVDQLKIDRAFVAGLGVDAHDTAISASIVLLAETLGLEVTAEGVEHPQQLRHLTRLNTRYAQGYLFSPARPADEIDRRFPGLVLPEPPGSAT